MDDRDHRVRDEAYRIWDEAGRPEGSEQQHWYEAERRVAEGDGVTEAPADQSPKRGTPAKVVVKNAGNGAVEAPLAKSARPAGKPAGKGDAVEVSPARKTSEKPAAKSAGERLVSAGLNAAAKLKSAAKSKT